MIKVLVVEDSKVIQELIKNILSSDKSIELVGVVNNGKDAVDFVKRIIPDVITMDVQMPIMDGLEATKQIMANTPVPIIIVSSLFHPNDVLDTFKALKSGAVSVVEKPHSYGTKEFEENAREFLHKIKLMAEIKVIKRTWSLMDSHPATLGEQQNIITHIPKNVRVIALGASTGGPVVIEKILSGLPKTFNIPILLVQHITAGFTEGFIDWLNTTSSIPVVLAKESEKILGGRCYVAPDNKHLLVDKNENVIISGNPPENNLRPAVSVLFRSVEEVYGFKALGILLTGMGRDGAAELKVMKDSGSITITQSAESCVVYGMPGEAVKLNGSTYSLSPEGIIDYLCNLSMPKELIS